MGQISVFDTVSNNTEVIHRNGKLKNIFAEIDLKNSIVLKAGERLNGEYEVQENDVLYVRKVPHSTTVIAVIAIVSAVVAIGVGVGSAIYANEKSKQAQEEMEKAQRDAKNLAERVSNLPFIRGAKNKNALGNNVQFVMGSVFNTPYNITGGFYSLEDTDGVKSYYNASFSCGYSAQRINKVIIGNEPIITKTNINGVNNFDQTSLYYNPNNKIEVRQSGEALTLNNCNQKVVATYSGAELKHNYGEEAEPIIVQAAENAQKIQVCIQFSCLRQYNSEDETWEARTAIVRPYWSNNGGQTWTQFYFDGMSNNELSKNVNHTIRYCATKTFTAEESFGKQISIKVVKETPMAESGSQENCSLLWYQTFCYDAEKSTSSGLVACTPLEEHLLNKTTRVAYRIEASENTNDILDELHCFCEGLARTWSNNTWSVGKSPTRNPASWLLEILTSNVHSPSHYTDSEINLASFGALYDYCENMGFHTDGIITADMTKQDILTKILQTVNADIIINKSNQLEVVIDKEEDTPIALLNDENIKSITYAKDLNRKMTGTKVTYVNRTNEAWAVDTFYSMLDGGSYDYTTDKVNALSLDWVTEYEHAYKVAQRKLREQQLMPYTIKASVGLDGDYYPLFSLMKVAIPELKQSLRSSVISGLVKDDGVITDIIIADQVEFASGYYYGVTIQATSQYGVKLHNCRVTGTGKTRTLHLLDPITDDYNAPVISNHLSFGYVEAGGFSKVAQLMKIYGVEPDGNDGYNLTLKTYNPEVYQFGTIPAYKSNITKPQKPNSSVTIDDINKLRQDMNVLQKDLIDAYQLLSMPLVVDADVKQAILEIDEEGKTATTTTVTVNVWCRQGDEERPFIFGNLILPEGWNYTISGKTITFTIGEGVRVRSGQFAIPIVYRPAVNYNPYVDENGDAYVDESGNEYMEVVFAETISQYNVYFTYMGIGNGVYLQNISHLSDIPETANLNDYFTWAGTDHTQSSLSIEGEFKQGRTYKYVGTNKAWSWEVDEDAIHNQTALSNVLGLANADLRNNNSTVYEFLDHLTANTTYTDMLVANQAFINQIAAHIITADFAKVSDIEAGNITVPAGAVRVGSSTLVEDGKISTNLLKVEDGFFNNISMTGTLKNGDFEDTGTKGTYIYYDSNLRRSAIKTDMLYVTDLLGRRHSEDGDFPYVKINCFTTALHLSSFSMTKRVLTPDYPSFDVANFYSMEMGDSFVFTVGKIVYESKSDEYFTVIKIIGGEASANLLQIIVYTNELEHRLIQFNATDNYRLYSSYDEVERIEFLY